MFLKVLELWRDVIFTSLSFGFINRQHGADVNAMDHTGQIALHWSAVRGAIQVAELLLQEGGRVNAADVHGYQVSESPITI